MPAARDAAGPRRHGAGQGRRPRLGARRWHSQVVGALGPIPPERRAELGTARRPARRAGRRLRPRADLRRPADRPPGRRAAGRHARAAPHPPAAGPGRAHDDLAAGRAGGGHRARRAARRRRRDPAAHGRGARLRRHRLLGPAAAGVDVQDDHATGALEAGITNPSKVYPVQQKAVLEGVDLENANGEYCGGTLIVSFAKSCNSVFAPLGAQLGAKRLVDVAERYGFNQPPDIPGRGREHDPGAPTTSATTSRSARRRSARAACRPPRCRWPRSPPPSACAAAGRT